MIATVLSLLDSGFDPHNVYHSGAVVVAIVAGFPLLSMLRNLLRGR